MKKTLTLIGLFYLLINQNIFCQCSQENKYDVKQYILDLQISNTSSVISGNVVVNAKVVATVLDTFVIDLINNIYTGQTYMTVDSVFVNGAMNSFQHNNNFVYVPLLSTISQNQLFSVQIYYHGISTPCSASNYDGIHCVSYAGNNHTYSSVELYGSKLWFPSKNVLTDKADSVTFYITTDSTNKTGSNGLLESKTMLPNGKCKYKWVTHYPIAFYLISFVVGPHEEIDSYTILPNTQDSVKMMNLLIHDTVYYPIHLNALKKTDLLMKLYSEKFGTYPFKKEKYGNAVVGVTWDGMEHQTMSTMGLMVLDTTMTYLGGPYCWGNAHEFAHHWFGDYVTCATWNDTWLNEGMATYVEYIALQNLETQARADIWLNGCQGAAKSSSCGSVYVPDSIVSDMYNTFGTLTYFKGGASMHMMRYEINNDSLFFAALRNYLSTYAYSNATTHELEQSIETTTGIDFTDFFNQWIFGQGYPTFNILWTQGNDTVYVHSNQTTSCNATTLFKTHFDLKLNFTSGDSTLRLYQGANNETYKIYCPKTVASINFDPNNWLLQNHTVQTGIAEYINTIDFSAYPNPTGKTITIDLNNASLQDCLLSIYNLQGQLMKQQQIKQNTTEVDVHSFEKGSYILKINDGKRMAVSKFVKE